MTEQAERSRGSANRTGTLQNEDRLVLSIDYVEFWVGNLELVAYLLTQGFGFDNVGKPPPRETAERAEIFQLGSTVIVVRQSLVGSSELAHHVSVHGDTIRDVAFVCVDPEDLARRAQAAGAVVTESANGWSVQFSATPTVSHTLSAASLISISAGNTLPVIDHVTYCLPFGTTSELASEYCSVFGFETLHDSGYGAVGDHDRGMRSIVVRSGGVTLTLTEPASASSVGQTQRFLTAHDGPGIQHVALAFEDLMTVMDETSERGISFLPVKRDDLETSRLRLDRDDLPWAELLSRGILVDADEGGLLFQTFTRPITGRGTFFFEMLQRRGSTGFGANNFRALFNAVEATAAP